MAAEDAELELSLRQVLEAERYREVRPIKMTLLEERVAEVQRQSDERLRAAALRHATRVLKSEFGPLLDSTRAFLLAQNTATLERLCDAALTATALADLGLPE